MIQKQSQKPELTKEQKEAQKEFIFNKITLGRIIWLLVCKHKFELALIYGVFITVALIHQAAPALAALGQ